jgi:hypothetical protein
MRRQRFTLTITVCRALAILSASMLTACSLAQAAPHPGTTPAVTAPAATTSPETPTATAAPSLTPTLVYALPTVDYERGLGLSHLYVADTGWPIAQPVDQPADLRIPAPGLVASKGRFMDIRGNDSQLFHLGSDFLNPANTPLVPPSDHAILGAAVYLDIGEYEAIALDMAGNIQFYLVTVAMPQGVHRYLIGYAHLEQGSNQAAEAQALANGGHVQTIGRLSTISAENPLLSDLHISVIDVERLLARTRRSTLRDALLMLFSSKLERTDQQFADIFVRPEDIIIALQPLIVGHE